MADAKITALTELTTPALEDLLPIVDDPSGTPVTKKIALSNLFLDEDAMGSNSATKGATQQSIKAYVDNRNDGWSNANETWAYASATTITVPSGAAAKYRKGDKIKLTQTTVKYFYIVSVADTVLTVTGGLDYTVANAAITLNYYSHQSTPIGFPHLFNFTAAQTGFSVDQSLTEYFYLNGTEVTVVYARESADGTSNATTLTFSLPVAANSSTYLTYHGICYAVDNTSVLSATSQWEVRAGESVARFFKSAYEGAWTNSGAKSILGAVVTYLI